MKIRNYFKVLLILVGVWLAGTLVAVEFDVEFEGSFLIEKDAHAVVGRPLTPVSYAGVARRTSRRTTRRVAARQASPAGAIMSLPAGCAKISRGGAVYFHCGASYYRPYYDGPQVVYVPATF